MIKLSKETMFEILEGGNDKYDLIKDEMIDHTRWSVIHELIFHDNDTNKFYRNCYSVGATESQDEGPWEYDGHIIESEEVFQVYETVIVYRNKKE